MTDRIYDDSLRPALGWLGDTTPGYGGAPLVEGSDGKFLYLVESGRGPERSLFGVKLPSIPSFGSDEAEGYLVLPRPASFSPHPLVRADGARFIESVESTGRAFVRLARRWKAVCRAARPRHRPVRPSHPRSFPSHRQDALFLGLHRHR